MTYIKWKDEVESYLMGLSEDERNKILSYFSEMYADKRDAGKSEAQIISEFGAPYDVAKRVLEENGAPAPSPQKAQPVGADYIAPDRTVPPAAPPPYNGGQPQSQSYAKPETGAANPAQPGTAAANSGSSDAARTVLSVFLTIALVVFSIGAYSALVALIITSVSIIGSIIGGAIAGGVGVGFVLTNAGFGLILFGVALLLAAPLTVLEKFLWRKLRLFTKGGTK